MREFANGLRALIFALETEEQEQQHWCEQVHYLSVLGGKQGMFALFMKVEVRLGVKPAQEDEQVDIIEEDGPGIGDDPHAHEVGTF